MASRQMKKLVDKLRYNPARRRFIKQTAMVGAAAGMLSPMGKAFGSLTPSGGQALMSNLIGFNGERCDPVTGCYHLGNGYRMYNPGLMRFHAADSMSPFGKGGINSYAYCLGDPINLRDPSGHFALMSLLIGAMVGAAVGAVFAAAAEGIRAAVTHTSFDWKQVGIGAALGAISGGFGAAAQGAKAGVQVGLAVTDSVVSGATDFGLNMAAGSSAKDAAINAGIGAVIGLMTFGVELSRFMRRGKKPITLKGTMKNLDSMGKDIYFFDDFYKERKRLNIAAHGILQQDNTALLYRSSGQHMSASDLSYILSHRKNLSDYSYIKTIMCYSGNGGDNSFGKKLSNLTGMPVKSYIGTVTGNFEVKSLNKILLEATALYGDEGLNHMRKVFSDKHIFKIHKGSSHVFLSPGWFLFNYNPIYFPHM